MLDDWCLVKEKKPSWLVPTEFTLQTGARKAAAPPRRDN